MQPDTFPRQKARTRGFQLGRPRGFTIAAGRVLYVRSAAGDDPVGSLWMVDTDGDGSERLLVDARALLAAEDGLPPAEQARRERMREVTSGITAFSVNRSGTAVAFSVSGVPFLHDVDSGTTTELPAPGPVVDPRIAPDVADVAYVCGGALWVVRAGESDATELCRPEHEHVTWGLADFIAAEELDRHRGHWWVRSGLLVERCDDSPVAVRWIADPARPELEPRPHRYPQAGTDNADVQLWLVGLDGTRRQVSWDAARFPYLASVHAGAHGTTVQLLTRDQRTALVARLDEDAAELVVLAERTDEAWVDVMPGVPALDADGRLLEIVPDRDANRLVRDGTPVTPPGLQVRALLDADGCVILASAEPDAQAVYAIEDGAVQALTDERAFAGAAASGDVLVTATSDAEEPGTEFAVRRGSRRSPIVSRADQPLVRVRPHYAVTETSQLRCCVLLPTDHVPGSRRLPVIASPYGGPHGQRVVRSAQAFATEQWIADQGFAVVVADGRGTPGRGPAWERAVHGDLATAVLADQVEALQSMAGQFPDLDLARVGIRGWSFGGYLAALAVMDRPDVFHAAVAGAPVTDWQLYDTAYTERYLGHPDDDPAAYARSSLIERADRLARPLLLIHGLADDNVLAAHTLRLSSALLAAGRAHAVVPLSGVTHMTPQEVVAENLLRLEVDFFREHLSAQPLLVR